MMASSLPPRFGLFLPLAMNSESNALLYLLLFTESFRCSCGPPHFPPQGLRENSYSSLCLAGVEKEDRVLITNLIA